MSNTESAESRMKELTARLDKMPWDFQALSELISVVQTMLFCPLQQTLVALDPESELEKQTRRKQELARDLLPYLAPMQEKPSLRAQYLLLKAECLLITGNWVLARDQYWAVLEEKTFLDPVERKRQASSVKQFMYFMGSSFGDCMELYKQFECASKVCRNICTLINLGETSDERKKRLEIAQPGDEMPGGIKLIRAQYDDLRNTYCAMMDKWCTQDDRLGEALLLKTRMLEIWDLNSRSNIFFDLRFAAGLEPEAIAALASGKDSTRDFYNGTFEKLPDGWTPVHTECVSGTRCRLMMGDLPIMVIDPRNPLPLAEKSVESASTGAIAALEALGGLEAVKNEVRSLLNLLQLNKERKEKGLPVSPISLHLVFTGNPGIGKTTVARIIADIYKEQGLLSQGQLVEVKKEDVISPYVGDTPGTMKKVIKRALGGVLFIDEAYTLADGQYGQEAIDTLLAEMENHRDDMAVIVAGYPDDMKKFIDSNPGLKSRFSRYVPFEDYNGAELLQIMKDLCRKNSYILDEDAEEWLLPFLERRYQTRDKQFGNARSIRQMFEKACACQADRLAKLAGKPDTMALCTLTLADIQPASEVFNVSFAPMPNKSDNDPLAELDQLTGLSAVKKEIRSLVNQIKVRKKRQEMKLPVPPLSLYLVFTGNPGTGKTTVARLVAQIYRDLGVVSRGQLVEVSRGDLVAEYVGQTAAKTSAVIQKAMGGVLFIDEAYTLVAGGQNDYGQEAIDTLLKAMEDHREDLVVIAAGYPDNMKRFISSNPGLESRFSRYVTFEDYTGSEMMEIMEELCRKNTYLLDDEAKNWLLPFLQASYEHRSPQFGNARNVRKMFEKACACQADRLADEENLTGEMLSTLTAEDLKAAADVFTGGI